jgi:hypothetical protein
MGVGDFLKDWVLGKRPDMQLPPGLQPFVDFFQNNADPGLGKVGKWARQDIKAMRRGDDMTQIGGLRPIANMLQTRHASRLRGQDRQIRSSLAFENQPALEAAMLAESTGNADHDLASEFADASSDYYNDANDRLESARRFRVQTEGDRMRTGAGIYQGGLRDMNRTGGLLSPEVLAQLAGAGAAAYAGRKGSNSTGLYSGNDQGFPGAPPGRGTYG